MPFLSKAGSLSGTKPLRICPLPWLADIVGDYCNDGTLLIVLANGVSWSSHALLLRIRLQEEGEKSAWQLAGCCHFVCSLPSCSSN